MKKQPGKEKSSFDELPAVLSQPELSKFLRIGRSKTYELLRLPTSAGGIPHVRLGKQIRVTRTALLAWLAEQQGGDTASNDTTLPSKRNFSDNGFQHYSR